MDGQTDGQTDRRTFAIVESLSRLKMIQLISYKVANHCILHLQNKTVMNIYDKGVLII